MSAVEDARALAAYELRDQEFDPSQDWTPAQKAKVIQALITEYERLTAPVSDAQAQIAEEERESHRYSLVRDSNPIQVRCVCGWVGLYAGEWRLHRERSALEAARGVIE